MPRRKGPKPAPPKGSLPSSESLGFSHHDPKLSRILFSNCFEDVASVTPTYRKTLRRHRQKGSKRKNGRGRNIRNRPVFML